MRVLQTLEDDLRFALGDLAFQNVALQQELQKRDQRIVELEAELKTLKGEDNGIT